MAAHFSAQSIVKKQEDLITPQPDSGVIYPDMAKFHPGGGGAISGQSRAARQIDYANGFEAGKAEASEMYEQTIRVMEAALEGLKSSMKDITRDMETSHGEVVKQCLQALLPELSQEILRHEIQCVISEAATSQADIRLSVNLNPDNEIAKSFLQKSFGPELTLVESNEMDESAVHFFRGDSVTKIDPVKTAQTCLGLLGIECAPKKTVERSSGRTEAPAGNDLGENEDMQEAS